MYFLLTFNIFYAFFQCFYCWLVNNRWGKELKSRIPFKTDIPWSGPFSTCAKYSEKVKNPTKLAVFIPRRNLRRVVNYVSKTMQQCKICQTKEKATQLKFFCFRQWKKKDMKFRTRWKVSNICERLDEM